MDTNNKDENKKYGEFIPTYFAWMSLDEQKKRAEELNNIGKKTSWNTVILIDLGKKMW